MPAVFKCVLSAAGYGRHTARQPITAVTNRVDVRPPERTRSEMSRLHMKYTSESDVVAHPKQRISSNNLHLRQAHLNGQNTLLRATLLLFMDQWSVMKRMCLEITVSCRCQMHAERRRLCGEPRELCTGLQHRAVPRNLLAPTSFWKISVIPLQQYAPHLNMRAFKPSRPDDAMQA